MKNIDTKTDAVKAEERRYKGRLSYYTNTLGLSPEEAERRAKGGGKPNTPTPANGEPPAMSEWQKRQQKKKAGQVQVLEVGRCPQCEAEFFARLPDGKGEKIKLPSCPLCKIRFYFAQ